MADERTMRRPVHGVHSLDQFRMEVPDLAEARRFFEGFGLAVEDQTERLLLRTFGDSQVWAQLTTGPRKRLTSLRFGIYERDEAWFRSKFPADGSAASNSIWCVAPDGLAIELAVLAKSSPDRKIAAQLADPFVPERGAAPRNCVAPVRPRRLAHVALFTDDVSAAVRFYCDDLGMGLSDRSGDDVAFVHGIHGSDHHMVALGRSNGPGLHHSSWDVATLAEVGLGAAQMARAGHAAGWGLGRHVLGSNFFHYVRDPWGSYTEYSADMDYVPMGSDWPGGDHPGEDSFYQWGPPPPNDFMVNRETLAV